MGTTFFLVAIAINGTVAHVVPLLTDRGISTAAAAATMRIFGLATLPFNATPTIASKRQIYKAALTFGR
jgi:hypothetical protein